MTDLNALRKVANIETLKWEILEQPGLPNENVWWYNISYNEATGEGSYLYKMGPGAQSNPHEHEGPEEFYMLDGELIDVDGKVFKKGDFISFEPGSTHSSFTEKGCLILVFMRSRNKTI